MYICFFLALFGLALAQFPPEWIVETKYGPVLGVEETSDSGHPVRVWRSVPYASPPLGVLRFRAPIPPRTWAPEVLPCFIPSVCPQGEQFVEGEVVGSEDCLYLDIYNPTNATGTSKLPVMVWIFGGGWVLGDPWELGLYDATNRVDLKNYVHVAVNYRLSALGFLALDGLRNENRYGAVGNYGLQDQQAALRFIKDNIAAFGGDPTRVTLFGEATGADSICWHLVSPGSAGLFHTVIMESGNCETSTNYIGVDDAMAFGNAYSALVGCNYTDTKETVHCMRALPVNQLLSGWSGLQSKFVPALWPVMPWGPVIDKSPQGLTDVPFNLIKQGKYTQVPVILGTNQNEGNIFIPIIPYIVNGTSLPLDRATTKLALLRFFNSSFADTVLSLYEDSGSTWESCLSYMLRDYFYTCPARRLAGEFSKNVPTFLYHFTYVAPDWRDQWLLGDYHGSELVFVYGNAWPPERVFNDKDKRVINNLANYWNNFASSTSTPNSPAPVEVVWPRYNPVDESILNIRDPLVIDKHYLENACTFWDKLTQ